MNKLDPEKYEFFYGGVFSQWFPVKFTVACVEYNCAEQFMMAGKAKLFRDEETLTKIMAALHPREQKALGREVKGFDESRWNAVAIDVVVDGNIAKFAQHPNLQKVLLATGDKILVEASPYDCIWGIGLGMDDSRIYDKDEWRGTNWLGEALMKARAIIKGCHENC